MIDDTVKNSSQSGNSAELSYFVRFKQAFGIAGYFFFAIFVFVFWTNLKWVIGDINMYSIMTTDEISKVMSTIIPFDSLTSFILMILSGIAIFYFLKLNKRALLFTFYFLVIYPILLGIVEFGYSGNLISIFGPLIGAIVIIFIFWSLYKKEIKVFLPFLNTNK
ncbi:MAG: hypothetical protein ACOCU8_00445 [Patescibacteria group bacterium]